MSADCSAEQLANNRANGKKAEAYVLDKLSKKANIIVIGAQVHVKTPGLDRGRRIDILIRDIHTGKIRATEVKYNCATRSALQKTKDKAIEIRYSTWKGQRLYLEDLFVSREWRGRGIGSQLFDALLKEMRDKKFNSMVWQVLEWNESAIKFYKKYNTDFDSEWINCSIENTNS